MRASLLMLALFAAPALPAPMLTATNAEGESITLHDEDGPCVGEAKFAVWQSPDKRKAVPGCYVIDGPVVRVVFLDGDMMRVPLGALKKPVSL